MIDTSVFPYSTFPIRLEYEDKSGKIICFFSCDEHLESHLNRYNLNKKKVIILRRPKDWIDTYPIVTSEPISTKTRSKVKVTASKRKPRKKKS